MNRDTGKPARPGDDALHAFLSELVDYAGLFPPARLDLDPALRNYARFRDHHDAWMLGRFIIPAARLAELAPYHDEFFAPAENPFRFTVLVAAGDSASAALNQLRADAQQTAACLERHGPAVAIEALEARLPAELVNQSRPGQVGELLQSYARELASSGLRGTELFLEIPIVETRPGCIKSAVECISRFADQIPAGGPLGRVGAKLRCGGPTAADIPGPERVALVIAACRDRGVPLKCTAGLHHPVRYRIEDLDAMSHGFLNVFGAGILAHARGLDEGAVERCLAEEEASHFRFTGDGFGWQDGANVAIATAAQVAAARSALMIGFGSCSFDEPREDLRSLGLLA